MAQNLQASGTKIVFSYVFWLCCTIAKIQQKSRIFQKFYFREKFQKFPFPTMFPDFLNSLRLFFSYSLKICQILKSDAMGVEDLFKEL